MNDQSNGDAVEMQESVEAIQEDTMAMPFATGDVTFAQHEVSQKETLEELPEVKKAELKASLQAQLRALDGEKGDMEIFKRDMSPAAKIMVNGIRNIYPSIKSPDVIDRIRKKMGFFERQRKKAIRETALKMIREGDSEAVALEEAPVQTRVYRDDIGTCKEILRT